MLVSEMLREEGGGQLILSGVFGHLSEAVAAVEGGLEVDLAILDLTLPDSSGIETYIQFSQALPNLPVIVLSGLDDEELAIEIVHQGAQDCLLKSGLVSKTLIRSINFAIERKRGELALKSVRDELEKRVDARTQALRAANQQLSRALDESSATQAQRIQQERLNAMERMASGIAHDFNNALSPILAHSEWLLRKPEDLADVGKLKKALCKIHESAEYCAEIVMRLRGFYHTENESGHLETLELDEVLMEAICLTQMYWKDQAQSRGCEVVFKTQFGSVPKIDGIRNELRQMFTDLILNAVDAIQTHGVITASVYLSGGKVAASIVDNGAGMNPEVLSRCLEPFFTTKNHTGIGLGLGVVHGIAQRHKAGIEIESQEGKGTKVTLEFPISNAEKAAAASPPLSGLRILVVEDEPNIREVLAAYLAEDGHKVELVANGVEALDHFEPSRFDLLLTDYSMPRMNGDLLAAEIRARDPKIRIALLTGFGASLPQGASLRLEIDAIISKPFTFETLRQGIAEAMEGHGQTGR